MAQAGSSPLLCHQQLHKCDSAITDYERRSAEIRRVDGGLFGGGSKAYPLKERGQIMVGWARPSWHDAGLTF